MVPGNGDGNGQIERREGNRCRGLCLVCALAAAQGSGMLARGREHREQSEARENANALTCRHGEPALPVTRARGERRVSLRSTAPRSPRARATGNRRKLVRAGCATSSLRSS
jgi:hypothetical protein